MINCEMLPYSTTRLLQILRSTSRLLKYYEEDRDTSLVCLGELQNCLRHSIDELSAIARAEGDLGDPDAF